MEVYDLKAVSDSAQQALVKNNHHPDESRIIFQGALLDWQDHYAENFAMEPDSFESRSASQSIANLWIEYAQLEISLRQFRQAVQIYENALEDPVACKCVGLFQSYARYCQDRGKLGNAQKVLLRGLSTNLSRSDVDTLWMDFLDMMKATNPTLTLNSLCDSVLEQLRQAGEQLVTLPSGYSGTTHNVVVPDDMQSAAESKVDDGDTPVDLSQSKNLEVETVFGQTLDMFDDVTRFTPEELRRVYFHRPAMIFCAPSKEPMISGLASLSHDELLELENFFGFKFSSSVTASHPPKLTSFLDILEALWSVQALKERHFDCWFRNLAELHSFEERERLTRRPAVDDELSKKFANDMLRFHSHCEVQREILDALVNKTLTSLLLEQQRVLVELNFPFFNHDVLSRLEEYYSSSKSASDVKLSFSRLVEDVEKQRRVVCSLLSLRLVVHQSSVPVTFAGNQDDVSDFYSAEAKKQRREQRSLPVAAPEAPVIGDEYDKALPSQHTAKFEMGVGDVASNPSQTKVALRRLAGMLQKAKKSN